MLINIINNHHTAESLLSFVEEANRQNTTWGVLHIGFSELGMMPSESEMLLAVRPVLDDKQAALYFFRDGDIAVAWNGAQKSVLEALWECLKERFPTLAGKPVDRFYDIQAHGEDLRLLCKQKMSGQAAAAAPVKNTPLELTAAQADLFHANAAMRKKRTHLEILIVEDQAFSSKLLLGMLDRSYKTTAAATASQALELYINDVPDIVFLDIELPDASGHELAALIQKLDAHAFIVMVTGNHFAEDVARARANNVQGFIVKPYSKQKILEYIQICQHGRKLAS